MFGYLMIPGLFAVLFAGVYSWYVGASALKAGIMSGLGAFTGAVYDGVAEVGTVLNAGITNFGSLDYLGMSILVIGLTILIGVIGFNVVTTLPQEPRAIQ